MIFVHPDHMYGQQFYNISICISNMIRSLQVPGTTNKAARALPVVGHHVRPLTGETWASNKLYYPFPQPPQGQGDLANEARGTRVCLTSPPGGRTRRSRSPREDFKYYFADFVRKWGTPPRLRIFFWQKRSYGFGGYPPPPLYGLFPEYLP